MGKLHLKTCLNLSHPYYRVTLVHTNRLAENHYKFSTNAGQLMRRISFGGHVSLPVFLSQGESCSKTSV